MRVKDVWELYFYKYISTVAIKPWARLYFQLGNHSLISWHIEPYWYLPVFQYVAFESVCAQCAVAGCSDSIYSFAFYFTTELQWVHRFLSCHVCLRPDFTASSATEKRGHVGCSFFPEDYVPGDMMEFGMEYQNQKCVRLRSDAVPLVHTVASSSSTGNSEPKLSKTLSLSGWYTTVW